MIHLDDELGRAASVAIAGHIRPDGDCVGSCIGLYLYIKEYFPQIEKADVYLEEFPESFVFLKGAKQVKHSVKDEEYDLLFCLDAGDAGRLGEAAALLKKAKRSICIDHHVSNVGYADSNWVIPTASSTSELVCRLIGPGKIKKDMAEALYMGIAHDTGIFQYSCTSPETMRLAADLMETGIDFSKIVEKTYFQKTYAQNQILGYALQGSKLTLDGRCILSAVHQADMEQYHVTPMDLDGIVSQMRNTVGVETAVFLYETQDREYKVSMRSNGMVNVQQVASVFGGGGHMRAAGCTMQGSFEEVTGRLLECIEKQATAKQPGQVVAKQLTREKE